MSRTVHEVATGVTSAPHEAEETRARRSPDRHVTQKRDPQVRDTDPDAHA